jgi:hypothetical protein
VPAPALGRAVGAGVGAVGGVATAMATAAKEPLLAATAAMVAAAGMNPQTGQLTNLSPPAPPLGQPLIRAPSASAHSHHNHNHNHNVGPKLQPIEFNQEGPYFGFVNHSSHRMRARICLRR